MYDIIVVGCGTAGVMAAIAAARRGMKVLVLEKNTYPGGTYTGGFISGCYDEGKGGLIEEMDEEAKCFLRNGGYAESTGEVAKLLYERELLKYGCTLAYEAVVTKVLFRAEKSVSGVVWHDRDGFHTETCGCLIDSTADARVCALAGCELQNGREADGLFQPFTFSAVYLHGNMAVWTANPDAGRIDQNNADEFSAVMLASALDHLKERYTDDLPRLIAACDIPGLREGNRIVPETSACLKDFLDGSGIVPEPVLWSRTVIDTHANDYPLESEVFQDWMIGDSMWAARVWFGVPRGTMVPKGFRGILAAARHVGVDHDLAYAIRMNGAMSRLGEAAGAWAALSVKTGKNLMEVPYEALASEIRLAPSPLSENEKIWGLGLEEIKDGLASDKPGCAAWSARRRGDPEPLLRWFAESEPGSELRCHADFALALMGHSGGMEELRRMLRTRDPYIPRTGRKYNHARGYVALYFLGKLRDADSLDLIFGVLADDNIRPKYEYHTHAVGALMRIGDSRPDLRTLIAEHLRGTAENPDWHIESRHTDEVMWRRDPVFRIAIAKCLNRWNIPHEIPGVLQSMELRLNEENMAKRLHILEIQRNRSEK